MLTFELLTGIKTIPYLEELGKWRLTYFKEYPYLYQGTIENEQQYVESYASNEKAFLLIVKDQGAIVAISSGMPLSDPSMKEAASIFKKEGFEPESFFYFGELIVLPQYRSQGIGSKVIKMGENYASKAGFTSACFMTVQREVNHPLKPKDYKEPDSMWQHLKYKKTTVTASFEYKTIQATGEAKIQSNAMAFWTKDIS